LSSGVEICFLGVENPNICELAVLDSGARKMQDDCEKLADVREERKKEAKKPLFLLRYE